MLLLTQQGQLGISLKYHTVIVSEGTTYPVRFDCSRHPSLENILFSLSCVKQLDSVVAAGSIFSGFVSFVWECFIL